MRRRFFVDQFSDGRATVEGSEAQHLTRVLRVEVGQQYEVSDNRTAYLAEIETVHKSEVIFRTLEELPPEPERLRLVLCASLVKFDHFEWMIEKATELGVSEIIPIITARVERGLDKAAEKRVERWRRIAVEASQQSRRTHLPIVHDAVRFADAITYPATYRYVLDEAGGAELLSSLPPSRNASDSAALLVGPEGGWTEAERIAFTTRWTPVSMGPLILRAETAAMAAIAVVQAAWRGTLRT
jgi:16S rRNA (uracil1498-N3)-methyltransferase